MSPELLEDLYALCLADAEGKGFDAQPERTRIAGLRAHVERILAESHAFTTRDLAIDGRALMSELDRGPGPWLGKVLEGLLDRVLDDPSLNERSRLVAIARDLVAQTADR